MEQIEKTEKYILVAVATGEEEAAWASLEELGELVRTDGAEVSSMVVQNLDHPERATYVGSGKALEIREMLEVQEADGIICDDELTPSQFRNLSEAIGAKVLDRTLLILDIFADHAKTKEGKIQVEIAQQRYRASRLRGMGEAMSRLGAGIGTRGPGETKLETDRRVIQKRIKVLSDEIEDMKRVRETTRKKRSESATMTVAIVGYTNAGKSTLLNKVTDAGIPAENKLFATLDPTTRTAVLPDGQSVLLTDTVGFINKLPHHLVDAFRSTLEEAKYADIIMHVIDASNPQWELHRKVVLDTLKELGVVGKPVITVWNKMDLLPEGEKRQDFQAEASVMISAKKNLGLEEMLEELGRIVRESRVYVDTVLTYSEMGILEQIRKFGQLLEEKYEGDGIHVKGYVPHALAYLAER